MSVSLLDTFRALDDGTKETLADIMSPRLLAFATLKIAKEKYGTDRLSAEHITACLEAAGVAVRRVSVSRALASAHGYVAPAANDEGETVYSLMTKGHRQIEPVLGGNRTAVMRIDQGQPRTARLKLSEILGTLSGMVRICDPYYGIRTLDALDLLQKSVHVRFLTQKTNEAERKLHGALRDFKTERPNVEFRVAPNAVGLHDRYIVTTDLLLILGHGLKDIGGKESFIVRLDKGMIPDLLKEVSASFDNKWNRSTQI
jgi:hypothetical protein